MTHTAHERRETLFHFDGFKVHGYRLEIETSSSFIPFISLHLAKRLRVTASCPVTPVYDITERIVEMVRGAVTIHGNFDLESEAFPPTKTEEQNLQGSFNVNVYAWNAVESAEYCFRLFNCYMHSTEEGGRFLAASYTGWNRVMPVSEKTERTEVAVQILTGGSEMFMRCPTLTQEIVVPSDVDISHGIVNNVPTISSTSPLSASSSRKTSEATLICRRVSTTF
jgi:hypothetical protein